MVDDVLYDFNMLQWITKHHDYIDIIRLSSTCKCMYKLLKPIRRNKLNQVTQRASKCLITLKMPICYNPRMNKSLRLCIRESQIHRWLALKSLLVDYWYIFHVNPMFRLVFIDLMINKTSLFYDLFIRQKWYENPLFKDLSKHIHIDYPEYYTKQELMILKKVLNFQLFSK